MWDPSYVHFYLYIMTFWGSMSIALIMSHSYYNNEVDFNHEILVNKICVVTSRLSYNQRGRNVY